MFTSVITTATIVTVTAITAMITFITSTFPAVTINIVVVIILINVDITVTLSRTIVFSILLLPYLPVVVVIMARTANPKPQVAQRQACHSYPSSLRTTPADEIRR